MSIAEYQSVVARTFLILWVKRVSGGRGAWSLVGTPFGKSTFLGCAEPGCAELLSGVATSDSSVAVNDVMRILRNVGWLQVKYCILIFICRQGITNLTRIRFNLPATNHRRLKTGFRARKGDGPPDAFGRDRVGKDVHDGECDTGGAETDACDCAQ